MTFSFFKSMSLTYPRHRLLLETCCVLFGITLMAQLATAADSAEKVAPRVGESCVLESVERIQRFYDSVTDLEGRFVQSTEAVGIGASLGGEEPQATGRVVLAKPGRMRWEYEVPEPSLVISNGKSLWIYDPSAGEAQHLAVTEEYLSGAALQFLMGGGVLLEEYDVQGKRCSPDQVDLVLRPKSPATYEWLELRADRKTGQILETVLVDLLGNTTRLSLHDMQTNRSPDASRFVFVAPPGVRVIDLGPLD